MTFLRLYFATLRDVATDRSGVLMLMLSILIYSVFYPAAYNHQVTLRVPLAVVDQDNSSLSRKLTMAAAATQGVDLTAHAGSMTQGRHLMETGDVDALLWIGPGFERAALRGEQGDIALFGNGAYLVRTRAAMAALGGAVTKTARDAVREMVSAEGVPAPVPVQLTMRPLYNVQEGYGSALVPGVMVLVVHQTLLLGIGLMMATWRAHLGRQMSVTMFFARAAAFATIGICGLLYFCGMAFWQQDYPRGGNLAGLLLAAPIYAVAVVMLGMFLGSFFVRREQPGQLLLATSLPFFFLSGLTWPQTVVPPAVVWIAKAIPATPATHLIVKLTHMDASLSEAAPELTSLAILAAVFGVAAWMRLCLPWGARIRKNVS